MSDAKRYRSEAMEAAHETAEGLYKVGAIDRRTMRQFDADCLAPIEKIDPLAIKSLREREQVSQKVFAFYLNVPVSLVSQWERGKKHPSGAALKLLSLVNRHGLDALA